MFMYVCMYVRMYVSTYAIYQKFNYCSVRCKVQHLLFIKNINA